MAWSLVDYNEFLDVAGDVFGLSYVESKWLYFELSEVLGYGSLTYDDLVEYADVASSLVETFSSFVLAEPLTPDEAMREPGEELPEEALEYDYEFDWQDKWFEVGDEIEITADLHYE